MPTGAFGEGTGIYETPNSNSNSNTNRYSGVFASDRIHVHTLTPGRRRLALFTLALGGFSIGITEFASMGVLPNIAEDLLPDFTSNPAKGIAQAGTLITLYALGVVIGAPVITALAARVSQTTLAFWLLGAFTAGSIASAAAPTFETLAIARLIAGLPHATFFGASALLAGRLMGPGNQGKGIAIAMSGLPIANVLGVPLATWIGQTLGWRWAYALVSILFALTLLLALRYLPRYAGDPTLSPIRSLAGFKNIRIWIMVALGAIGFGGFFAVYSYIAEVVTRVTAMPDSAVPWVLSAIGIGMTIGTFFGGWMADRNGPRAILFSFAALIASLSLYVGTAATPVGLIVSVLLIGFWFSALLPAVQSRFIRMAREAELMGSAITHAAFNVANALGAWLGGLVIAAGFGYLAPGWAGIVLAVIGGLLAIISISITRRDRHRSIDTTGIQLP